MPGRIFQYQARADVYNATPERPTPDKWLGNEPVVPRRQPAHSAAVLAGALFFVPVVTAPPAQTPIPDATLAQVRAVTYNVARLFDYSVDGKQLTLPERATPDKWSPVAPPRIYRPENRSYLEPCSIAEPVSFAGGISWYGRQPAQILDVTRRVQLMDFGGVIDKIIPNIAPTVTIDKWFVRPGELIRATPQIAHLLSAGGSIFINSAPFIRQPTQAWLSVHKSDLWLVRQDGTAVKIIS